MVLNAATVGALVRLTLTRPREAAERLLAMNVPDDARWLGFVIVVILSVILGQGALFLTEDAETTGSLLFMAMLQSTLLLGMVVAVQGVGRAMGGKGSFPDTLLLIAWLQFVMLVFQVIQTLSIVLAPPLFSLIAIASVVVFMWLLTRFIMVLHGFQSAPKVFVSIILTVFGLSMLFAIIIGLFGFGPGDI